MQACVRHRQRQGNGGGVHHESTSIQLTHTHNKSFDEIPMQHSSNENRRITYTFVDSFLSPFLESSPVVLFLSRIRSRIPKMRRSRVTPTQRNMYRCFGCFHVRSGAMALGSWHLMVHLFAICLLAYLSTHLDEINKTDQTTLTIFIKQRDQPPQLANLTTRLADVSAQDEPVALSVVKDDSDNIDEDRKEKVIFDVKSSNVGERARSISYYWSSFVFTNNGSPIISQRDLNLAFLLGCITVSIALMMLVGIVKGRPAYLVPFLTYQVMDLLVSCLTVAGFVCYGSELRDYFLNDSDFPFQDELQGMDSQWVTLFVALLVLSVVFVKAYFVQVTWMCIRYLKEEQLRRAREECQPKVIYLDNAVDPELSVFVFDDNGNIVKTTPPPPTYETCTDEKTAPPAYTAATSSSA